MTSTNFANTVLGEAVNAATQKLATELDAQCLAPADDSRKPERLGCRCIG